MTHVIENTDCLLSINPGFLRMSRVVVIVLCNNSCNIIDLDNNLHNKVFFVERKHWLSIRPTESNTHTIYNENTVWCYTTRYNSYLYRLMYVALQATMKPWVTIINIIMCEINIEDFIIFLSCKVSVSAQRNLISGKDRLFKRLISSTIFRCQLRYFFMEHFLVSILITSDSFNSNLV